MKEKKIAREERNQEKLANGDWVMAEFYATWCPHCQRMKPVVEEFKKLMEGTLEVVLVDIDRNLPLQISIQLSRLLPLFFLEKDNSSGDNPANYLWKDWKEQ